MRPRRVLAVAGKECREILRDRLAFALAFLLAPVLMLVFGVGLTQDVENVPLAVVDEDGTPASRDYLARFTSGRSFAFRGALGSVREGERRLVRGDVRALVVVPPRFGERVAAGRTAEVQVLLDGTFTTVTRTVRAYVEAISQAASIELAAARLAARLGVPTDAARTRLVPLRTEVRYLYNEEVRSIWSMAPSLVMLILTLVVPLLAAVSLVRERESGAIYNVYSSTVGRAEFLLGKLLPNVAIGFLDAVVLWLVALSVFRVPFRGDLLFFAGATLLYVVVLSAVGLVVSLVVATQQAAVAATVILMLVTAVQFSGMLTPLASLTGLTSLVARLLPASYYTTLSHGAFLKGAGVATLWREALVFTAHAGVLAVAGVLLFRKRLAA